MNDAEPQMGLAFLIVYGVGILACLIMLVTFIIVA